MAKNSRFIKACRKEQVDATPIWLMRQAGRYLPEYRALRKKHALLDLMRDPELATEVTLQPLRRFDLDAAIIFSDILPLLGSIGLDIAFKPDSGPVVTPLLENHTDLRVSMQKPADEVMSFTLKAIELVQNELQGNVPLIGFSGAPFTLACYAIEGHSSKNFLRTKQLMYEHPQDWHQLMNTLTECVGGYLQAQVKAGVDAVQLFDSWVGVLSPVDYESFVLPYAKRIVEMVKHQKEIPFIHFGTGTSGMLPLVQASGADVVGIDWRIDLKEAWETLGEGAAVQGNLDPTVLLAPSSEIKRQTNLILDSVDNRPGHIFNLGHGVLQPTPMDNVQLLVEHVHAYSEKRTPSSHPN